MADFDSSLPIRSEADVDERVQTKIVDSANPDTQQTTVDTSGNLFTKVHGDDPGSVNRTLRMSEQGHISIDGVYDVTNNTDPSNVGIVGHTRAATPGDAGQAQRLTAGPPTSSAITPANVTALDVNAFNLAYDSVGDEWTRIESTGSSLNVNVTGGSFDAELDGIYDGGTNTDPDNVGLIAHVRNATLNDTHQTERLTSVTDSGGTVKALDVAIHDASGEDINSGNPLPVTVVTGVGGDRVHDFKKAIGVAKDATDNHDYIVTAGKTLSIYQVLASASGKTKVELLIEDGPGAGTYTPCIVEFNSTATPNTGYTLPTPIQVAAGVNVRIAMTNRDNQSQDLYSTIIGIEE